MNIAEKRFYAKKNKSFTKTEKKIEQPKKKGPRVLIFDIETSPTLGYVWRVYEDNLLRTEKEWFMLSVAYKWADDDQIKCIALPDFPAYKNKANRENDVHLVKELWNLFNEADLIIAHNGDAFDIKKANARFIAHEMQPPSHYKTIDTLKAARRHFKFNSNRLNDLGSYFDIGVKLPNTGKDLWFRCMAGDPEAWKEMKAYNIQDVKLLEQVYYRLRPWISNHPNMNLYSDTPHDQNCPKCESSKVIRRGFNYRTTGKVQQMQCTDCGGYFSAGKLLKNL